MANANIEIALKLAVGFRKAKGASSGADRNRRGPFNKLHPISDDSSNEIYWDRVI